jgi:CheY-like chemotaxis protein
MISARYPCCFYPTEVIFVDDNTAFLQTVDSLIRPRNRGNRFRFFSSSDEALAYINRSPQSTFAERCVRDINCSKNSGNFISIDTSTLCEEMDNPDRFRQVSVVIVAQQLDDGNGDAFCRAIRAPHAQKIFLVPTGHEGTQCGIAALNQGFVEQCISRQQLLSIDELLSHVYRAQVEYFTQLSSVIYASVKIRNNFPSALCSIPFENFFKTFLHNNRIVEYYLFDMIGSCVLIDDRDEVWSMFVQNMDQHRAMILEIQDEIGQNISVAVGEQIKAGKSIFCCPNSMDIAALPPGEWCRYVRDATSIFDPQAQTVFYCALSNQLPYLKESSE